MTVVTFKTLKKLRNCERARAGAGSRGHSPQARRGQGNAGKEERPPVYDAGGRTLSSSKNGGFFRFFEKIEGMLVDIFKPRKNKIFLFSMNL